MNKFLSGTALAVVALCATPAAAEAPAGPRIEIHGGADIERVKLDGMSSPFVKVNDTGILYGVGAGFDFPITPGVSLGIEGSADRSTAKLEKTFLHVSDLNNNGSDENLELTAKPRWILFVGPRVSFAVSDASNFYLNGGYTRVGYKAKATIREDDPSRPLPLATTSDSESDTVGGWRVGAGAQTNFGSNTYVGVEVNYSDLKDNFSRVGAQLALGYRFGGRPVEAVYVPPVAAPLPEPAPATQTCADGSVILATDICPAPPMPAPAPERG